jgi:chemotaxis protein methyltransferase WspC
LAEPISSAPVVLRPAADLNEARRLADKGQLDEALALCTACLAKDGASAEAHYLLGVVRDAMGDGPGALECYRRVLYLQPDHEDALFHLAILTERQGDPSRAQRLRERVQRASKGRL